MITEADTKNARGRPKGSFRKMADIAFSDMEPRTAVNQLYAAALIIDILHQQPGDFFISNKGKFRRQGIAEQIGRLYTAGTINEEQAEQLAAECMRDYADGIAVKTIQARLATLRKTLQ